MKEQNIIAFFIDGSSKIFHGPMTLVEECPAPYSAFVNKDGAWSLNMEQVKYLCVCTNDQLSEYLGSLDQSHVNFDVLENKRKRHRRTRFRQ